ncbi:sporulation protein YqfD [Orenia metallireducens]|uniref:Sporulation protein YqfD n=1 Tax=Orenia metallireducens TaxID=1413210 RepID=A0A1C0A4Z8_9FIRM|nr:sporulation protein YqfD [Orenia metallireducens]OCL25218.1 sporulation protein YqfD [Orenia metallireducens]
MLKKLYTLVEGYLRLEIQGANLEKCINILMREGFKLWDIIRIGDRLYVNIRLKDFKNIRPHLRRTRYKVRINQKRGLPFFFTKVLNRRFLIIGLIFLVLSLYTLSSFLFFIEIQGTKEIEKEEILEFLREAKIRPGVLKSSIPLEDLEKALIRRVPRIAWVNIHFSGTTLIVELVEKKIVDSKIIPSDIVAAKAGIISKLIVLKGTPMVEEGMTVKKGDLLISKEVFIKKEEEEVINKEDEETKEEEGNDRGILVKKEEVKAEGIIKARIWYEGYGEAKLVQEYEQLTDNSKTSIIIKFKDKKINLKGPKSSPYTNFKVVEEVKSLPKWRNIDLPIELVTRRYIKVKKVKERIDLEMAKQIAKDDAVESILQGVSKEAIILNSKLKLIDLDGEVNNIIRIKALLEIEEEIGVRKE